MNYAIRRHLIDCMTQAEATYVSIPSAAPGAAQQESNEDLVAWIIPKDV